MNTPIPSSAEAGIARHEAAALRSSGKPGALKAADQAEEVLLHRQLDSEMQLVNEGYCADLQEARLYLRLHARRAAGEALAPDQVAYLDGLEAARSSRAQLAASRSAVILSASTQASLQARVVRAREARDTDKAHLAALEDYGRWLAEEFIRGNKDILPISLANYGAQIQGTREMQEFLTKRILPEHEFSVASAEADLEKFMASTNGPAAA